MSSAQFRPRSILLVSRRAFALSLPAWSRWCSTAWATRLWMPSLWPNAGRCGRSRPRRRRGTRRAWSKSRHGGGFPTTLRPRGSTRRALRRRRAARSGASAGQALAQLLLALLGAAPARLLGAPEEFRQLVVALTL